MGNVNVYTFVLGMCLFVILVKVISALSLLFFIWVDQNQMMGDFEHPILNLYFQTLENIRYENVWKQTTLFLTECMFHFFVTLVANKNISSSPPFLHFNFCK